MTTMHGADLDSDEMPGTRKNPCTPGTTVAQIDEARAAWAARDPLTQEQRNARTIDRLERANDEAVRAREAALDARLRASTRGVTEAEAADLQADVDRTAVAAREAQAALLVAMGTER